MIKDRLIVCIASSWDYDPTSKHHIMSLLSRENDILWVNYHGSRRPAINRADLADVWRKLKRVAGGLQWVAPSFAQFTPLVIPGAANPLLQRLHQRMVISQIRRALRTVAGASNKKIQVWSFAPDVPYLVGAFDEECFIYYCVDEYRQFEGFDSQRIAAAENKLVDRADIVITTSEVLLNSKRKLRSDVVLVRHGVDYDHFAPAQRQALTRPPELDAIPRPIFGFFGLIHRWIDCALIAEVARLRPLYSFVLIGDAKVDTSQLDGLANVFLLGRRRYRDLPAYCAAFDAALLPFTTDAMTRNVNPVKMCEYLAAGLPVISTPLPEARRFEHAISVTETPRAFAEACDRVVAGDVPDRDAIGRTVQSETWQSKVEYISDLIAARTNPILRTASMPSAQVGPWRQPARQEPVPIDPSR